MALPILLDCDPGHDDAIAIVLALASPELDVKAITSSAGNQTPEKTLRNVLRMLTLLNRTDIPVAGGAVKPLMRELIIADNVHGESGLDGPALPEPTFAPQNCTAVELMAKTLRESAEPVTIVSTGPQTNVALLLNSHPELHSKIARIVIMAAALVDLADVDVVHHVAGLRVDAHGAARALKRLALHGVQKRLAVGALAGLGGLVDDPHAVVATHRHEVGAQAVVGLAEGFDKLAVECGVVAGGVVVCRHHAQRGVAHGVEGVVVGHAAFGNHPNAGFVEPALGKLLHQRRAHARGHEGEQRVGLGVAHFLQEGGKVRAAQGHAQ